MRGVLAAEFPAALADFDELTGVLVAVPDSAGVHADLGRLLFGLELLPQAERELLHATALDGDLGSAHLQLGEVYRLRADTGRASWHLRRALQALPGDPDAHRLLALVLRDAGDAAGARAVVEQGLAAAPGHEDLLVVRGQLELDAGLPERAAQTLRLAVEGSPDHPRAHLLLGEALLRLDRGEEAGRAMREHGRLLLLGKLGLLGRRPPVPGWRRAAALAAHHLGMRAWDAARVEVARSLAERPGNAEALVVQAGLHRAEGDEATAARVLEQVLADDPGEAGAAAALALLLVETGDPARRDPERALELARRAVERRPDAASLYALGVARSAAGQAEGARDAWRRALAVDPLHDPSTAALARHREHPP